MTEQPTTILVDRRRPVPERPVWVAAALVLTVVAVAAAMVSTFALLSKRTATSQQTYASVTDLVVQDLGSGDVSVEGSKRSDVQVERTIRWSGRTDDAPKAVETAASGTLTLASPCSGHVACSIDYRVLVPSGMSVRSTQTSGDLRLRSVGDVDARSSSGDIDAADVGSMTATTTNGDVTVCRTAGAVRLSATSGDVAGCELRSARAAAQTTSGDVHLTFAEAPDSVTVEAGSGDVDILLPPVGPYAVLATAGSGKTSLGVDTLASSPRSVQVTTGSGDIAVRYP